MEHQWNIYGTSMEYRNPSDAPVTYAHAPANHSGRQEDSNNAGIKVIGERLEVSGTKDQFG
jgi:hypothetical protein